MCEAGALGFIQSSTVPIRALYDRENDERPEYELRQSAGTSRYQIRRASICDHRTNGEREDVHFELEFDIRNHFKLGPVKYHNVVASIKGSKYPDEYVIISGHLDAFDVATGGIDCGTGIGPMMEAARMIAKSEQA